MTLRSRQIFGERRAWTLAATILAQALCAVFFAVDVANDFLENHALSQPHLYLELVATVALVAGVVLLMLELRRLLNRVEHMEHGLAAARGDMAEVIDGAFRRWGLTAAEREVALLLLKGFDNEAIADLRGTAKGTVRAQTSAIYDKAGVEGRAQLLALFLEELLAEDLATLRTAAAEPERASA